VGTLKHGARSHCPPPSAKGRSRSRGETRSCGTAPCPTAPPGKTPMRRASDTPLITTRPRFASANSRPAPSGPIHAGSPEPASHRCPSSSSRNQGERAPPSIPHLPPPRAWRGTQALNHRPDRVHALDARPKRSMRQPSPAGEIGAPPQLVVTVGHRGDPCLDIRRHSIDIWVAEEIRQVEIWRYVTHSTRLHNRQFGSAGRWAPLTSPANGSAGRLEAERPVKRDRAGAAGQQEDQDRAPGQVLRLRPGDTRPIRWPLRRPHGARVISETMSR
jgi:hypothetical protein